MATHILGIAGSLRKGSFNKMLLQAASAVMPEGGRLEIGTIEGIPLYDGDLEASSGIPEPAKKLKEKIAAADGLLIVTPEYNNSIPGVLKNAIDWTTRPPADAPKIFGGRPVAVMGATPGRMGTILAQAAWLPIFHTLGMKPFFGKRLLVSGADKVFDESGKLIDDKVKEQLTTFLSGFVAFAAAARQNGK